jgi:2'-5' RNA ligase
VTDIVENEPAQALRLFFALWPDDATRDALNGAGKWLHQHLGGRRTRADTIHLTLAFLGATPAAQLDALIACADTVDTEPYELLFDEAGYWRHNRIGWLGATQAPPQHFQLVTALNAALAAQGFPAEARPHVPHVTLLRKAPGGDVARCRPVAWSVRDFVLVRSTTASDGAHYEVIKRWPLGAAAADQAHDDRTEN